MLDRATGYQDTVYTCVKRAHLRLYVPTWTPDFQAASSSVNEKAIRRKASWERRWGLSCEILKLPLIKRLELTVISRRAARGVVSRRRLDLDAWFPSMKAHCTARTLSTCRRCWFH